MLTAAAQSLEASCWIPLLLGKKVVLAGDHNQLPPTIVSEKAARAQKNGMPGLSTTLFDRLVHMYGDDISRMLTEQYRMNELIMQWSSDEFYGGRLTAHTSVAERLLCNMDGVEETCLTKVPLVFIDTCGEEQETLAGDDNLVSRIRARESKSNEGESEIVLKLVEELLDAGVKPGDIGVIAPYSAQVDLLRSKLGEAHPLIDVGTVDGFQGREKEAIV